LTILWVCQQKSRRQQVRLRSFSECVRKKKTEDSKLEFDRSVGVAEKKKNRRRQIRLRSFSGCVSKKTEDSKSGFDHSRGRSQKNRRQQVRLRSFLGGVSKKTEDSKSGFDHSRGGVSAAKIKQKTASQASIILRGRQQKNRRQQVRLRSFSGCVSKKTEDSKSGFDHSRGASAKNQFVFLFQFDIAVLILYERVPSLFDCLDGKRHWCIIYTVRKDLFV